ncbi:hypothetical protein ACH5RR_015383 [Cinchona calisaya]|uniref:Smr domain-containing protein n=1 Tax=Cinchona calisaya TaxID=153742 RepID=A0ABD2ZT10_9GENT
MASFASASSFEEAEAMGDANKGAEILGNFASGPPDDVGRKGVWRNHKKKTPTVCAGTVSMMLGNDYVRSVPKSSSLKSKGIREGIRTKEEETVAAVEQFLCSMLGEDGELNMAVIRDVLYGCGYDVEKALNVLLDIDYDSSKTSDHSETEELSQQVLESLFNIQKPKNVEPNSMNWRNIVKKMTSLGRQGTYPGDGTPFPVKGYEYKVFREAENQHRESMKSCHQKAATAFSNGGRDYAALLSEKGRTHHKMAKEAEEKASQDIFKARNKGIENMITIDLHGQHVKQAIRIVKLHLLFGAYVRSVRSFRVITGCGRLLKQSVINLLEREGIRWSEENIGTLLIRLDQQTEFTCFLDCDSEDE